MFVQEKITENTIPRSEYPRPQFCRKEWINLNGEWEFQLDQSRTGTEKGFQLGEAVFSQKITVPFCPQSELSGVGFKDFIYGVWYRRHIELSTEQCQKRVVLHFGAVDYCATVFVNGSEVCRHRGGYVSFEADISDFVVPGDNIITVFAEDNERDPLIPRGKQCEKYHYCVCDYARTSGIWQTVWLEFTPKEYISSVKYFPDIANQRIVMEIETAGKGTVDIAVSFDGREMANASLRCETGRITAVLSLAECHLWELGKGDLYDVSLKFGEDLVSSYFGLREVCLDGIKFMLNGKSVFQRLVLDQGFYPDGIYTAPDDAALINDIRISMDCGFNGARLHQKIFEERFLYHCDRMGYMVWGEYPDWGLDFSDPKNIYSVLPEWIEEINRDFNHPAIIGWCPHNETWYYQKRRQYDDSILIPYEITKKLDPTRPCIDTSGGFHTKTDIFDVHNYLQDADKFKAIYDELRNGVFHNDWEHEQSYHNEPAFVSEFGGFTWSSKENGGWGYGEAPKTEQEFKERFLKMCKALLDNEKIMGFCYTQLTDVEQEQNGLYTYNREPKFDYKEFKELLSNPAAIEK